MPRTLAAILLASASLLPAAGCAAGRPSPATAPSPLASSAAVDDDGGLRRLAAWVGERRVGVEYAVSDGRVVAVRFDADKVAGVDDLVRSMPTLPSVEEVYFWGGDPLEMTLTRAAERFPNARLVALIGCPFINGDAAEHLLRFRRLQVVFLSADEQTEKGFRDLLGDRLVTGRTMPDGLGRWWGRFTRQ
ncbi:MAG TPA: hypothetical protein VF796_04560 [Humisphaera sp.]